MNVDVVMSFSFSLYHMSVETNDNIQRNISVIPGNKLPYVWVLNLPLEFAAWSWTNKVTHAGLTCPACFLGKGQLIEH